MQWQYFPRFSQVPEILTRIVQAFEKVAYEISTPRNQLSSNKVLSVVADHLGLIDYKVVRGKTKKEKICRPILCGKNGVVDKSFEVDAWHEESGTVVEVEAGRAVINHQFLKDFFEACVL